MLVLEEQPKQDYVQKNSSNIPEFDAQPAENESLQDFKSNYEREEKIVDAKDNCDAPVIYMGKNNEVPMIYSDNVDENIFTINIPSIFTSSSFDYKRFSHGSNLKMYVEDFLGLYYNAADEGYKCRICDMFPSLSTTGGHSRHRFASEVVKKLTDHPKCYLKRHAESEKYEQYENIIIIKFVFQGVFSLIRFDFLSRCFCFL